MRVIAVGGGKGGAGKSLLAANIGIFLASVGKRVVLLDYDPGGANLHAFMGCDGPLEKSVVIETSVPGVGLVSEEAPAEVAADYLIVDLGPGSGSKVIEGFLQADVGVLVVVPEPTSIESTYRFVKHALARRIFRPCLVVNQVRTRSDEDLGLALANAARRRLGITVDYLGHVEHDDAVWLAVRKRRPLLVEHPESLAAKGIERVTRKLMSLEGVEPVLEPPRELTHHELLDVDATASDREIRRAYRRAREIYAPDSLVVSGLYTAAELEALHRRFEAAYEALLDPARPRRHPSSAGGPLATPSPDVDEPPSPRRPEPEIGPKTEITGAIFRELREARGIDLHAISQKTKIGVGHLRAIEEERFDLLPALVYVRGFLQEYAKALRLDVGQVLATYLERVRAAKANLEDRG
jgi:flagellar biosynthesis protein FlhG